MSADPSATTQDTQEMEPLTDETGQVEPEQAPARPQETAGPGNEVMEPLPDLDLGAGQELVRLLMTEAIIDTTRGKIVAQPGDTLTVVDGVATKLETPGGFVLELSQMQESEQEARQATQDNVVERTEADATTSVPPAPAPPQEAPESESEAPAPETTGEPQAASAADIADLTLNKSVSELTEAIKGWDDRSLDTLRRAEVNGKNRSGALSAIDAEKARSS